jgi:phage terminase large subunit-like protein
MCSWVPGEESPNRIDALVHALTDLMIAKRVIEITLV